MERNTDVLREVSRKVEEMSDSQKKWQELQDQKLDKAHARLDGIQDRVEQVESNGMRPGKTPEGRARHLKAWKVFETASGPVYELPASVKMADAIPPKQQPDLSIDRVLAAMMCGERCEDKAALDYVREQKQLVTTTSGMLIPQEYQSEWIDLIRAQMALMAAGATTVTMDAKTFNASAVASDPIAAWHTEAGSINVSNPTFAARSLTAQTLVTRCTGSVEVSQDCPDFGAQLARVMAKAMAEELDRVGLIGSGTPPEPHGILGTSGIKRVTSVGAIADYSELLLGVRRLLESNVPLEIATAKAIMSPSSWAKYEGLATGISSDKTQLPRPRALEAMSFLVTTNGLDTGSPETSTIFLGDFRDVVLGVRREASVESLKLSSYGTNLLLEFVGYLRADYMLRRPASLCTLEDVTVS